MFKKRISLFLVAVMLMSVVLTGCSSQEMEMYQIYKKATLMSYNDPVSSKVEMDLDLSALKDEITDDESLALFNVIANSKLISTTKMDAAKDIADIQVQLQDKATGKVQPFIHIMRAEGAYFFDIKTAYQLVRAYMPPEDQKTGDRMLAQTQWLKITDQDYVDLLSGMTGSGVSLVQPRTNLSLSEAKKQQNLIIKLYDGLENVYGNMGTDTVRVENGYHTFKLSDQQIYPFFEQTAFYTLDHMDALLAMLANLLKTATDDELAYMGVTREAADRAAVELVKAVNKSDIDEARAALANASPEMKKMFAEMFAGTTFEMAIKETAQGKFEEKSNIQVSMKDPSGDKAIKFGIKVTGITEKTDTFTLEAPRTAVKTVTEFSALFPTKLVFYDLKDNTICVVSKGGKSDYTSATVQVKSGRSYVPAQLVQKTFDMKGTAPKAGATSMTLTYGGKTARTGIIQYKNQVLVKVGDLQQLGLIVAYDKNEGTLTVKENK